MRPEHKLEDYFISQAQKKNCWQCKLVSGYTGVPDRLLIGNGRVVFVELKSSNGILSARQKLVIAMMRKHGAIVFTPRSKQAIDSIFTYISSDSTDSGEQSA